MGNQPESSKLNRLKSLLDWVATVAVILLAATMMYVLLFRDARSVDSRSAGSQASLPLPVQPLSLSGAWLEGSARAPVAVIQYSDFECPYCREFANGTLLELRRTYVKRGDVLLAFRHLPLSGMHPLALPAARAAECAGRQGRFWQVHDWLFRDGASLMDALSPDAIVAVGLDAAEFARCSEADTTVDAKIAEDVVAARALHVTGTPTFFVGITQPGGQVKVLRRLSGALSLSEFQRVLDPLLPFSPVDP